MALTLNPLIPATRSGKTLAAALTLLGVAGIAQLLVLGGYLVGGGVPAHRAAADASESSGTPPVNRVEARNFAAPAPAVINVPTSVLPSESPALALARPTPAPILRSQNSSTDPLEQARQLRSRGDMNSALARLREAEVAEPDSSQIIAEMALTYEAMQMPDRAYEQWQRIYNQGEGIGALYNLADAKLHNVPSAASHATGNPTAETLAAAPDGGGFQGQGDTVLKLTDIRKEDLEDPAAEQKIALQIVVKNRPGTVIDPDKVKILAYFYDLMDGKNVVQTNAQTEYAWITPGHIDWANDKSEVLQTTYTRLKTVATPAAPTATPVVKKAARRKGAAAAEASPTPTTAPTPEPVRTYVGYCVQLYYNRQLQDVQADPIRLLQQFPAPLTLPAE